MNAGWHPGMGGKGAYGACGDHIGVRHVAVSCVSTETGLAIITDRCIIPKAKVSQRLASKSTAYVGVVRSIARSSVFH